MVNLVAKDILNQISGIHWLDKYSGIVRVVTREFNENGNPVVKRYPVSCDAISDDCFSTGRYKDLVPDSSKKSVIYFEENGGTQFLSRERDFFNYQVNIRMVGWLNQTKLGTEECSISEKAICDIVNSINFKRHNFGDLTKVLIKISSQEPKTPSIFNAYSYQESKKQFLLYPYDYFALNFTVLFSINKDCCEGIPENEETPCNLS